MKAKSNLAAAEKEREKDHEQTPSCDIFAQRLGDLRKSDPYEQQSRRFRFQDRSEKNSDSARNEGRERGGWDKSFPRPAASLENKLVHLVHRFVAIRVSRSTFSGNSLTG